MGKGVIRDDSALSVAASRTLALQEADVIILIGQTLNWMYNFGDTPRYSETVLFIQIESCAEDLQTDKNILPLLGTLPVVLEALTQELEKNKFNFSKESTWWSSLESKKQANIKNLEQQMKNNDIPLTYHRTLGEIKNLLSEDAIIVNEGANTLDIHLFFFNFSFSTNFL